METYVSNLQTLLRKNRFLDWSNVIYLGKQTFGKRGRQIGRIDNIETEYPFDRFKFKCIGADVIKLCICGILVSLPNNNAFVLNMIQTDEWKTIEMQLKSKMRKYIWAKI